MRFVWPIACYTLLEAVRGRLLLIAGLFAGVAVALAGFLAQIAITETAQVQSVIIAALLRIGTAFLLTTFVVTSMVREFGDKGVELLLAQPLPRWAYVAGKYSGYAAAATLVSIIAALPLLLYAPPAHVLAWTVSLAGEAMLVAAVSLFCVLSLTHVVAATAAVAAFYVLARSVDAIRILATTAGTPDDFLGRSIDGVLGALSLLVPRLDRLTQAGWLAEGASFDVVTSGLLQMAVFTAFILLASLFDFHRQNF